MNLIELNRITKDYASTRALDDISMDVAPGITGLLGPNGAGKSTLIKVLLGLVRVSSGTGRILDFELGKQGRLIRQFVGYMPEDDCYIPGMSGIEVVRFSASLAGLPNLEGMRRSHEILDFCGMQQERYRNIETYSTGMRQKIKFACAIVHDPQLLILDEPTTGLDPEERESLLNRVRVLASDFGKTVILSTHILPDVRVTCEHVVIISRGKMRVSDSLENLSRPSAPTFTVNVLDKAPEVANLLSNAGCPAVANHSHQLTVDGEVGAVEPLIWKAAMDAGTAIQGMAPARNSLDEIFINAVKESSNADA